MEKNKEFDYEEIVNDQDPYQQYQEIKSLIKENIITKNKTVFMIGKEWWNQWKSYALNEDPDANPGPIDNMPLVDISNDSKSLQIKTVLNQSEFKLVSLVCWRKLVSWYQGGPELELFIIDGKADTRPISIQVAQIHSQTEIFPQEPRWFMISIKLRLKELNKHLCHKFQLPYYSYKICLWNDAKCQVEEIDSSTDFSIVWETKICHLTKVVIVPISFQPQLDTIDEHPYSDNAFITTNYNELSDSMENNDDFLDRDTYYFVRNDRQEVQQRIWERMQEQKQRLGVQKLQKSLKQLQSIQEDYKSSSD